MGFQYHKAERVEFRKQMVAGPTTLVISQTPKRHRIPNPHDNDNNNNGSLFSKTLPYSTNPVPLSTGEFKS